MSSARGAWPDGARCAVAIGFDVDGPAVWIDADRDVVHRPAAFSVGAYGLLRATPRLLALLARHDLKATFFVPGWVAEQWPATIAAIADGGHELGHHGYLHELYYTLPLASLRELIERSQTIFERVAGRRAVGFRGPSGDVREGTPELLLELGFSYSSTMRGDDRPYRWQVGGAPSDLVEIPADWALDDFPQLGYHDDPADPVSLDRVASVAATFENWRMELEGHRRDGGCFNLILHPQVIGTPGRARALEALIAEIRSCDDVWVATLEEVAGWWRTHDR